jgi:hypothetical protein
VSEMTFRGLGIWDLGIVGLGFVNLGHERAPFRAVEPWVEGTGTVASAYGPSTEGAGTRVCDGGSQREADSTEKQHLKEPLEQHYDQHMDAEQDSEGTHRHTDGAESKWCMVLEKEADVQTFDEQISEIHTAEHRAATNSTTEMVHGRARAPPRQTWRVSVDEGRLRVLVAGVLAIMIVAAYCEREAEEEVRRISLLSTGCNDAGQVPIGEWEAMTWVERLFWIIWHARLKSEESADGARQLKAVPGVVRLTL